MPDSKNVIYLDFNGRDIAGTTWNSDYPKNTVLKAKAFTSDNDIAHFSLTELSQIAEIWHQVAEDFAPFDVDVTTEEPSVLGPTTGTILITSDVDSNGVAMPAYQQASGASAVDVWGKSDYASYYSPAFVYYNATGLEPANIALIASHEMGHNLGLAHDGYSDGGSHQDYYAGSGWGESSWAPIMGSGYNKNVTEWSNGDYPGATQTQDDTAIIAEKLGYRPDDHDGITPLVIASDGSIQSTTPETDPNNTIPYNKGIIGTRDDVDYFMLDAAGSINLLATPAWEAFYSPDRRGTNLDIKLVLYDWYGNNIAESDSQIGTDAEITTSLQPGHYLLAVEGVGNFVTAYSDYGSLGQYFITGHVAVPPPTAKASVSRQKGKSKYTFRFSGDGSVDSDNAALTYLWDFGDGFSSDQKYHEHVYCSPGTYRARLFVTNTTTGLTGQSLLTHTIAGKPTTKKSADCKTHQVGDAYWLGLDTRGVNDAPVARASGSKVPKRPKFSVLFSSEGSGDVDGDALSYVWEFGDGFTSTEKNHEHAYCAPGSYTVKLTVTDPGGLSGQKMFTQVIKGSKSTAKSLEDCQAYAKTSRDGHV
ncbi:PKD domain-containing protein [Methylomicrobium lacus]|uniref:PKD domain-containing protein n=1 Tax=Methylomicrobium lacus TaxID=136992 RepID=UPI0035A8240B